TPIQNRQGSHCPWRFCIGNMSKEQTTEKDSFIEQATDQLALLFFQLIVDKNKKQATKQKKSNENKSTKNK
ncbi:MAG: hypothetical protein UU28_C0024G0016, partial [Parcubacteria group bacterium GW2011_GWD2_40_9]